MAALLDVCCVIWLWVTLVLGNTEIVNFKAVPNPNFPPADAKIVCNLSQSLGEIQLSAAPARLGTPLKDVCQDGSWNSDCAHEIWVRLALNEGSWVDYDKFTLRISWPASSPVDFRIDLLTPLQLAQHHDLTVDHGNGTLTKDHFARIRIVDTGVRTPWPGVNISAPAPDVSFRIICEPLVFGVLPLSLVSTIYLLVFVSAVVCLAMPSIHRRLCSLLTDHNTQAAQDKKLS